MARYRVRAIGADFDANDDGADYPSAEVAKEAAIEAGIAIACEEIKGGKKSSIVEAHVLGGDRVIGRFVVALSVEELRPA